MKKRQIQIIAILALTISLSFAVAKLYWHFARSAPDIVPQPIGLFVILPVSFRTRPDQPNQPGIHMIPIIM